MKDKPHWPVLAFWSTGLACLVQAARAYPTLPATVASHFNAAGVPDGFAPKGGFLGLYAGLVLFMGISLSAVARRIKSTPNEDLRLPRKDYWLAPERRERTLEKVGAYLFVFGAATNALLLDVFAQVIAVNRGFVSRLPHPLVSLAAYLLFTAAWIAAFIRGFRSPPEGPANS